MPPHKKTFINHLPVLAVFTALLGVCCIRVDVPPEEIESRTLLVMVHEEPKCFVKDSTRKGILDFIFLLFLGKDGIGAGSAADQLFAGKRAKKLEKILENYPFRQKLARKVMHDFQTLNNEVIRICEKGEEAKKVGCLPMYDLSSFLINYKGQIILVLWPSEYGIRNGKPYLCISAGLFDIDSGKPIWLTFISPSEEEIRTNKRSLEYWVENPDTLISSLDEQIAIASKKTLEALKSDIGILSEKGDNPCLLNPCTAYMHNLELLDHMIKRIEKKRLKNRNIHDD